MSDPRESSQHPILASIAITEQQQADALAYLERVGALDLAPMLFDPMRTYKPGKGRVRT